jgi:uncharacterized membrane protein (UPF0127 family)
VAGRRRDWRARLEPLAAAELPGGLRVHEARRAGERRRGLAGLDDLPGDRGLLLPRTRSVHTLGMRFALDLIWLDAAGAVVRVDRGVPPRRARSCLAARAVVEVRAGAADAFLAGGVGAPPARYSAPR